MKNILLILTFVTLFISCEKVVEIDVPSIEPKLIIDASFEVYFDENPVTAKNVVKLSLSADYFDEVIPPALGATVFLTNLADNSIINFAETNSTGIYEPVNNFIPAENIEYELTVIYDNETYKGKAFRVKSTPFTNVEQGNETLFSGNETELKVAFRDVGPEQNFYLFDFSNNLYNVVEDRFFNDVNYNFSYFYDEDDIVLPAPVTIKISGISEPYYTYFRILTSQSGQDGGGPFETVPSSLLGNMINTTNEQNFPLGYFHIAETDTFTLVLVDLED
ncbi:DUF4249 family protein [Polaribacter sp. Hel_I_88]|uniref:DUF4249 family protein n=1 Tax=Polaribacter sp. Hel_I_88 TaxID=1250006 RepID=UPI00047D8B9A|nr:DUF4249 family protein [Polaribacter sp. Hel_I_88]